MVQKIKSWFSRPSFLYVIITYIISCIFIEPDFAHFGLIIIVLFYLGLIYLVRFLAKNEEKQEQDYNKKCDEFFGSSVGPRTTIKAPDYPPPIILAKGEVEVVSNNTTEKKRSDGSVYHEQTIEFSISKPLDYMAIMGTKRQTKEELERIKDMKEDQAIRDEYRFN